MSDSAADADRWAAPSAATAEASALPPAATGTGLGNAAAASGAALERAIRHAQRFLLREQEPDGAWRYPMEGSSILPDAHLVIAHRLFGLLEPAVEQDLVERLRAAQLPNGGWPLYPGHPGHLSASVEAYLALRLFGLPPKAEPLRRARRFIANHGGLGRVSSLTRITLAVLGQMPWDEVPLLPIEILLLPRKSPFNLYSFVSFTRVHLVSIMALGELRYVLPDLGFCLARELDGRAAGSHAAAAGGAAEAGAAAPGVAAPSPVGATADLARDALLRLGRYADRARRFLSPAAFRERSLRAADEYLRTHQEPDGSWGNYILSTLFGLLALRALGYPPDSTIFRRGLDGLRALVWRRRGETLVQPCNSAVWSTALAAYCLHETGIAADHPALRRAARWLLDTQSFRAGDWQVRCPEGPTGTWGFQEGNALFPDVDDTAAAVRAVLPTLTPDDLPGRHGCAAGEGWVLAMQNADGGWSSFDKDCRSWWLERLPFNDMHRAMTDPSTADMTGRTLEFLGVGGRRVGDPAVDRAVRWLRRTQGKDGLWFGRWGIAYVYGTWAALLGLGAVGVAPDDPLVLRGVKALEGAQNADGGWGESCAADTAGHYVALGESTPSQSAWALAGLVASARAVTPAIARGIRYLLDAQRGDGSWAESYTTGAGFAGKLYLDYRFYKDVWPLQALGLARTLAETGNAWGRVRGAGE